MPFYHKQGKIPAKRHVQFRKPDGKLFSEELVSTEGFSSIYSLVYHCHPPTLVKDIGDPYDIAPKAALKKNLQNRSFLTFKTAPVDDYLASRVYMLFNNDVYLSSAAPKKSMTDYFYKNADSDEVIFVHEGSGVLKTIFGDIKLPVLTNTHDELGDFKVLIKKQDMIFPYTLGSHPFDAIGWDGYQYPYGFSIHNYEPITGRVHMPPPIHQTFEGHNFVICSFVPRLYDYHPDSIPAPYNHSNVDSDEVLYYVDGDFMSRKHVERGMISLHPKGIPHGPHPGTVEKSIGKKETRELAVMIDPFYPLQITEEAMKLEDPGYYKTWVE